MFIGICRVELKIYEAATLKEKRSVLQSLVRKLRNSGSVSVAEVDHQDKWQRAALGLAVVGRDSVSAEKSLSQAIDQIEREHRVEILHVDRTIESYDDDNGNR